MISKKIIHIGIFTSKIQMHFGSPLPAHNPTKTPQYQLACLSTYFISQNIWRILQVILKHGLRLRSRVRNDVWSSGIPKFGSSKFGLFGSIPTVLVWNSSRSSSCQRVIFCSTYCHSSKTDHFLVDGSVIYPQKGIFVVTSSLVVGHLRHNALYCARLINTYVQDVQKRYF